MADGDKAMGADAAPRPAAVTLAAGAAPPSAFSMASVLAGLRQSPKEISPIFFYDEVGSRLFERICTLPEYYPTRAETQILREHAREICALLGPDALLVELGSGASVKTTLVLDQLQRPAGYMPVDISRGPLRAAAARLRAAYPRLTVLPLCLDFTGPLPAPQAEASRMALFFPGSTIGNFATDAAVTLLSRLRDFAGRDGALVVGVDLIKDIATLERAYNDSAGVTAQFNLNILAHLNRVYGSDFKPDDFEHAAPWVAAERRIEMHLISCRQHSVHIGRHSVCFRRGERLRTETCHKYTPASFAELLARAGWTVHKVWMDPDRLFSIHYAEVAPPLLRPIRTATQGSALRALNRTCQHERGAPTL
jgi:L-histidine Nalpha-methyltransferase